MELEHFTHIGVDDCYDTSRSTIATIDSEYYRTYTIRDIVLEYCMILQHQKLRTKFSITVANRVSSSRLLGCSRVKEAFWSTTSRVMLPECHRALLT